MVGMYTVEERGGVKRQQVLRTRFTRSMAWSQTNKTLVCGLTRTESGHETGARAVRMYTAFPRLEVPKTDINATRAAWNSQAPSALAFSGRRRSTFDRGEGDTGVLASCFLVEVHNHLAELLVRHLYGHVRSGQDLEADHALIMHII